MNNTPTILPVIAGTPTPANDPRPIPNRHTGDTTATAHFATPDLIDRAIHSAHAARHDTQALTPQQREAILRHLANRVRDDAEELALTIAEDAGKVINDARTEVTRCINTLTLSANAARDYNPDDAHETDAHDHTASLRVQRVPVGPSSLITPFNFPLNLVAHKLGPAVAAANPFILKPADKAPRPAFKLIDYLLETDYPKDAANCLLADPDHLDPLTTDPRVRFVSFTGSDRVGWKLRAKAIGKRVALELGGNAACYVDNDLSDANREHAAKRLVAGAFAHAGQSCISVQRAVLHKDIADDITQRILKHTADLKSDHHTSDAAFITPMIDAHAADRAEKWIQDAQAHGATLLAGGQRDATTIQPTVLTNLNKETPLATEEAFAPVMTLHTADGPEHAADIANDSRFAIHAGIFTDNTDHARRFIRRVDAAGVVVNDVPTTRLDAQPYGGIKHSGIGREGPAYALNDMTELKALILKGNPA